MKAIFERFVDFNFFKENKEFFLFHIDIECNCKRNFFSPEGDEFNFLQ